MLKLITLASVAFIAASCPSLSVIAQGKPAATIGAGATTCGEFANYYRLDMKIEKHYFAWAQGYLTAFNAIGGHFLNLKPPAFSGEDQKTFLRRFCADNPLRHYEEAVIELIGEIKVRQ